MILVREVRAGLVALLAGAWIAPGQVSAVDRPAARCSGTVGEKLGVRFVEVCPPGEEPFWISAAGRATGRCTRRSRTPVPAMHVARARRTRCRSRPGSTTCVRRQDGVAVSPGVYSVRMGGGSAPARDAIEVRSGEVATVRLGP